MNQALQDMSKEEQRRQLAKDTQAFEAIRNGESFEVIDDNFKNSMDDLNDTLDKIARGELI